MSVKACLTSVAISVPASGESIWDRHRNLIIYSLARYQFSLKISCKSVGKFLREVDKRQTNEKTIISLIGGGN